MNNINEVMPKEDANLNEVMPPKDLKTKLDEVSKSPDPGKAFQELGKSLTDEERKQLAEVGCV